MHLHFVSLRAVVMGCLLIAFAGCRADDRVDRLVEQQEQILTELRNLSGTYQALVNRGLMVVPEQALQNKKGRFVGWRGGTPRAPAAENSPRKGPTDAKVTVIEFADFECPFCSKMAGVGDEVVAEYPGQVAFVYKHYPLKKHPNAVAAAIASWAAQQQGKFWQMHDSIFQTGDATKDGVRAQAEKLGLDMEKFDRDVASPGAKAAVFFERRRGRAAGVESTPTFFVDGKQIQVTSPEALKLAIARALEGNDGGTAAAAPAAAPLP